MSEQHIRYIRILRHGIAHQLHGILYGSKPAAMEIALNSIAVHRLPMAHMILCHHHITKTSHVICKLIIPLHKLRNAVNNLQNRFGLLRWAPLAAVDFPAPQESNQKSVLMA